MKGFYFLPLGGAGEIGMNLNMYSYDDQWVIVDMGVSFGDDVFSSIDVVMANPKFAVEIKDKILALVITHGHEDHIGAIPYIWPLLKCPIYATPFTADMIKNKLLSEGFQEHEIPLRIIPLKGRFDVGPFDFEYITLTHSIPEPNALVIRTKSGAVFHTGDWKFDDTPLIGSKTDYAALKKLGDEGILALVGDSTNALSEGVSGSEGDVRKKILPLFENCKGKIIATCFASNLARLATLAYCAREVKRKVVLVGGSLIRMNELARQHGLLDDLPPFLSEFELESLSDKNTLIICTGSQGEPRAALMRAARDMHPRLKLKKNDRVIFSSKRIPGNERSISSLYNHLIRKEVEIVTDGAHFVHVSGHPARDELREMYRHIRPTYAIPVHGELMHMKAHAELAESEGVVEGLLVENGDLIRLDPDATYIESHIDVGRLVADEKRLLPREDPLIQQRRRMSYKGFMSVSIVMNDKYKLLAPPILQTPGVFNPDYDRDVIEDFIKNITGVFNNLPDEKLKLSKIEEMIRHKIKRIFHNQGLTKPFVDIQFVTI